MFRYPQTHLLTVTIAFVASMQCDVQQCSGAVVSDPTDQWTPIQYASPAQSDFQNDQQTGNSRSPSDIVGDASNPAFFMQFDDGGTPGTLTDGNLLFRVRLGAAAGNRTPSFNRNLFVGLDGDGDGSLDLYLGVHHQGAAEELGIYGPGADLNVSSNTTSLTGPLLTFAETPANYRYTAVDTADTDIDADGELDYFLSFAMPFQSIVDTMLSESSLAIDQNTTLGLVMATATQDNSLNQDINGLPKSFSTSASWASLGAISNPIAPISGSISAVPEPSVVAFLGLFSLAFVSIRRRRSD